MSSIQTPMNNRPCTDFRFHPFCGDLMNDIPKWNMTALLENVRLDQHVAYRSSHHHHASFMFWCPKTKAITSRSQGIWFHSNKKVYMPYTSQGLMVNVVFMPWTPLDVCQFVGQWWFFVSPWIVWQILHQIETHEIHIEEPIFFDTPYKSSNRLTIQVSDIIDDFRQFLGIPRLRGSF